MSRRRSHWGMTLMELIVGLAVLGMVTSASAVLSVGLSNVWNQTEDMDELMLHSRSALMRIESAIRQARLVGYFSNDQLLLWADDSDGDDLIRISELVIFLRDNGSKTLLEGRIAYPSSMDQATLNTLNLVVDFDQFQSPFLRNAFRNDSYIRYTVIAENCTDFTVKLDSAPAYTRYVHLELVLQFGSQQQRYYTGSSLKAPAFRLLPAS